MSQLSVMEKLQLGDEKNLLIQGLPSSIEKQFNKLSFSKNVTPLLRSKKIDFALIFAINLNQLCNILSEVFYALHDTSKLWIAYPKTASKIASDLNRDCSWSVLSNNGYEAVCQTDLDHVWSAIHFKRQENAPEYTNGYKKSTSTESIAEKGKRIAIVPELESLFVKHHKAREFFSSLSFSNQKEYVTWIDGAKRSDTRARRLEVTVEKLLAGKKTPMEK